MKNALLRHGFDLNNLLTLDMEKVSGMWMLSADGDDDSLSDGNGSSNDDSGDNDDSNNDDDDVNVEELLGIADDSDLQANEEGETDDDKKRQTDADTASRELGATLKQQLDGFKVDDEDFGEDFDVNDPKALKIALGNVQKKAIGQTIQMMVPIIDHAMKTMHTKLLADTLKESKRSQETGKVQQAFNSLGYTSTEDKALAKTIFTSSIKNKKMSLADAVKATKKAMTSLNRHAPTNQKNNGSSQNTRREGKAALDELFN